MAFLVDAEDISGMSRKETIEMMRRLEEQMALATEAGKPTLKMMETYNELRKNLKFKCMRHRRL